MLAALPQPFDPTDYLVPLDACIPRKARGRFFRRAYLCLLDHPNDRQCVYACYRALRLGLDLAGSRSLILPLIGFDVKFAEGSPYGQGALGEVARKQVQQESLECGMNRTNGVGCSNVCQSPCARTQRHISSCCSSG